EVELTGTPAANDTFTLTPLSSTYTVAQGSTMPVANVSKYPAGSPAFSIAYDATATPPAYTAQTIDSAATLTVEESTVNGKPVLTLKVGVGGDVVAEVGLYGTPTSGSSVTIEPASGSTSREEFNLFAALDDI